MGAILSLIPLVAGFALLVKGADYFVDGASELALKLGVPALVVGLTVVALGTSVPEAAVSIASAVSHAESVALANVFGSNIMNILVVLGLVAVITEVPVKSTTFKIEMPFTLAITALLLVLASWDGRLGRGDSVLLLGFLVVYLCYMGWLATRARDDEELPERAGISVRRSIMYMVAGGIGVALGSRLAVEGAMGFARAFGVSERVIGLTVVALGTSLPELVTTVTAARKGETDLAIGGIVGSNVLNVLFVLGVAGVVSPMPFSSELLLDGIIAIASAALLWLACARSRSLRRRWGVIMLSGYGAYLMYLLFL